MDHFESNCSSYNTSDVIDVTVLARKQKWSKRMNKFYQLYMLPFNSSLKAKMMCVSRPSYMSRVALLTDPILLIRIFSLGPSPGADQGFLEKVFVCIMG